MNKENSLPKLKWGYGRVRKTAQELDRSDSCSSHTTVPQ